MKTIRNLITEKATRDKRLKFTSWVHHINEANLAQCYRALKRDKACGMDGDSGSVRNESGGEPARPCGAHENQAVSTETCQTGIHPEAGQTGCEARSRHSKRGA